MNTQPLKLYITLDLFEKLKIDLSHMILKNKSTYKSEFFDYILKKLDKHFINSHIENNYVIVSIDNYKLLKLFLHLVIDIQISAPHLIDHCKDVALQAKTYCEERLNEKK